MARKALLKAFIFTLCLSHATATWDYSSGANGPSNWGDSCGGSMQSPIDLTSDPQATCSVPTISFSDCYEQSDNLNYTLVTDEARNKIEPHTNDGCALEVDIDGETYLLSHFELHFSNSSATEGSEHSVGGSFYPMELQAYHYKSSYDSFDAALSSETAGAVAAFAIFVEISDSGLDEFEDFLDIACSLSDGDDEVDAMYSAKEVWQNSGITSAALYQYSGSLTSPGCSEVVTWRIFEDTLSIPQEVFDSEVQSCIGDLLDGEDDNRRPTQSTGSRSIDYCSADYDNDNNGGDNAGATSNLHYLALLASLFFYLL